MNNNSAAKFSVYKQKWHTEYDNEKHWLTAPSSQLTIKIDLQGKHETFRNFSAKWW